MTRTSIALFFATALMLASMGSARADVDTKACSAEAVININRAFNFLDNNMDKLKNPPFSLGKRRLQTKRIRRRMGRKLNKMRVSCARKTMCRSNAPRVAMHAFGIAGKKIRLCYDTLVERPHLNSFCFLVDTIAHEYGHAVGIPKDRLGKHGKNHSDRVYQFGWFAGGLCRDAGLERRLDEPPKVWRKRWRKR